MERRTRLIDVLDLPKWQREFLEAGYPDEEPLGYTEGEHEEAEESHGTTQTPHGTL